MFGGVFFSKKREENEDQQWTGFRRVVFRSGRLGELSSVFWRGGGGIPPKAHWELGGGGGGGALRWGAANF